MRAAYIIGKAVDSTSPDKAEMKAYAQQLFGDDLEKANKVIACESGWKPNAQNSTSSAGGLGQFIDSTWIRYRQRMGRDTSLDLKYNWIEALETMHYAVRTNGWGDWYASVHCHGII